VILILLQKKSHNYSILNVLYIYVLGYEVCYVDLLLIALKIYTLFTVALQEQMENTVRPHLNAA